MDAYTDPNFVNGPGGGSAVFARANLEGANFEKSQLPGASFLRSNLVGAKFLEAELVSVNFDHSVVTGSVFTGAKLFHTRWNMTFGTQAADFRTAEGLFTAKLLKLNPVGTWNGR